MNWKMTHAMDGLQHHRDDNHVGYVQDVVHVNHQMIEMTERKLDFGWYLPYHLQ
jgi:hypothetical protein